MNSKFKRTMDINIPKYLKILAPRSNSISKQHSAPEPATSLATSRPTPKHWHHFNSPIYVNHECPPTICATLLALADKYPQCLDISYAAQHIPSDPVVFVALPNFYTNGQSAVGFFMPLVDGDNALDGGGTDEGDGYAEMFFTACSDADLESPGVREQLRSPISGTEGKGEAIRYQKGETEFGSAWRVAAKVWGARVDENVFMKGR